MARVVLPGMPHHVTQRGSRRWNVFQDDADRRSYVDIFRDSAERFRLRIHAYCLMTNHVHFVVIPESAEAIWRTFQRSQGMYAAKFNIKYGFCGHLWQARPYSSVLDEKHFRAAVRYVERNPVRAGMCPQAED
jgi:putative transposase